MKVGELYKLCQSLNIDVITLVVYATIETKFQRPKNLPKTPRQKPAKNPTAKNPAKIFYDFLNKKPHKNLKQ